MSAKSFLKEIKARRTVYNLTDQLPISDGEIEDIVRTVIASSPTAFNHQGTQLVVLLRDEHRKLWDIARRMLKAQLGGRYDSAHAEDKVKRFEAAYGTVLFFEETKSKKDYASRFKSYADHFTQWGEHGNAMAQFAIWTAFSAEGCGCNLQHYNPLIDTPVKQAWGIDEEWQLKAQLVFGGLGEGWEKSLTERDDGRGRYRIIG